jgi:RND family efflux transporter MFP subunit
MRLGALMMAMLWITGLAGSTTSMLAQESASGGGAANPARSAQSVIEVPGRTQCLLTRKCIIAPVVLHPVVEVLVAPGDRVKKDQPLVKLDDDEPQADVRNKQALAESAKVISAEAQRYLAQAEKTFSQGAFPEQRLHEARALALKTISDERAARAALESAKAELEHYVVAALIDGVVSRLEVHPGMVSRPGTSVWGEIVDVRELDVRCELPPAQADAIALGHDAQITMDSAGDRRWQGKVVFISPEADKHTGLVPVLVRMANPDCRIRASVAVKVRFAGSDAKPK